MKSTILAFMVFLLVMTASTFIVGELAGLGVQAQSSSQPELEIDARQVPPIFETSHVNVDAGIFVEVNGQQEALDANGAVLRSRLVIPDPAPEKSPTYPDRPQPPQTIELNLFADTIFSAVLDRIESNASGSYSWIGHVVGVEHSEVILVISDDIIAGHIVTPDGTYSISPVYDDIHRVAEINSQAILSGEDDGRVPEFQEIAVPAGLAEVEEANWVENADRVEDADDGSNIDIMVLYTDDAASAHGAGTVQAWIDLFVAYTNQAYANSDINQRISLVHSTEVAYNEPGNLNDALDDLTLNGDGQLDVVHDLRNIYHADLVMLMVNNDGNGANYCSGLAWIQVYDNSAFENVGFSTMKACSFGSTIFAHELGHNMGGQHDWYMTNDPRPYPHAHGYVDTTNRYRTIMSYNNRCTALGFNCTRITHFANPAVFYFGAPTGVSAGTASNCTPGSQPANDCDADMRSTFNATAFNTSSFRRSQSIWEGFSSNWNDPTNWSITEGSVFAPVTAHRVPRAIDSVLIPAAPIGGNFPTLNADTAIRNMTIEPGATLTMSGGRLSVYGDWETEGANAFTGLGGTAAFVAPLKQTLSANGSLFNNVQIGNGGTSTASLLSNLNIAGDLTLFAGAGLEAGSHTINLAGDWLDQNVGGFTPGTGTVVLDGPAQTVSAATESILMSEDFNEFTSCCTSALPQGWAIEAGAFYQGPILASGPSANRWRNEMDGYLFSPPLSLSADLTYELEYDVAIRRNWSDGDSQLSPQTISVVLADSQYSDSITQILSAPAVASNTSMATQILSFSVPASGVYHLGLRAQQTGDDYALFDDILIRATGGLLFSNLIVGSGTTTFGNDITIQNDLTINTGAVAVLNDHNISVEGTVANNGTLRQTLDVGDGSGATSYDFLILQNAARTETRYHGVQITPDGGLPLGDTTVEIRGNQDCTTITADPLIRRCFDIAPTHTEPATIRYWLREEERNGQALNGLQLWDYHGGSWQQVGVTPSYGASCASPATCWFQWSGINAYSPMVTGSGAAPSGSPSDPSCAAPLTPDDVDISLNNGSVVLSWTGGSADYYEIWYAQNEPTFTPGADCGGSATCAVVTSSPYVSPVSSTPGNSYYYTLVAGNQCGSSVLAPQRLGESSISLLGAAP